MRRRLSTLLISALFAAACNLTPSVSIAQERISPKADDQDFVGGDSDESLIGKGILLFTNERFHDALEIFQKLIDRDQEDPRGYFYKAAVYSVTMQDYKTRSFEQEFNTNINAAIEKAESRIKVNEQDAEAQFYLGGSYGYRGIDKTMMGSWLGAFLDGTRGVFHLQKALSADPDLYDAYYGLGAYHYWVSAKSSILWFLPFFTDERARGIEELRLASSKGEFSRYEARASLITVLMNEGRWEEAIQEVEVLLKKFPEDLSSRIQKGYIMAELGRWDEVVREFKGVKEFLATRPYHGFMRELEAEYHLALASQRTGRSQEFFERCIEVRKLMGHSRAQQYIEGITDLKRRAQELCGSPILSGNQE